MNRLIYLMLVLALVSVALSQYTCPAIATADSGAGTGGSTGGGTNDGNTTDTGSGDSGTGTDTGGDSGTDTGSGDGSGNSTDSGSGSGTDSGSGNDTGNGTDTGSGDSGNSDNTPDTCTCESMEAMLEWAEGKRACVYPDQIGVPTVGIGFNLHRWDARERLATCGANYDAVLAGTACLSEYQIYCLFNMDMEWAEPGAAKCVSSFEQHPRCVQQIMIDMTFNLGEPRFCGWTELMNAFNNFDYDEAIRVMEASDWCPLVERRCPKNTGVIDSCATRSL